MKKTAAYLLIFTLFVSCSKDESLIPDVYVNYNTTSIQLDNIKESPGKVFVLENQNVGVAGLVFYNNGSQILAYDRCSSVNPSQKNAVIFLAGSLVEDKVSGAYFDLKDGSPVKAPAVKNLIRYSVSVNGSIITVRN